ITTAMLPSATPAVTNALGQADVRCGRGRSTCGRGRKRAGRRRGIQVSISDRIRWAHGRSCWLAIFSARTLTRITLETRGDALLIGSSGGLIFGKRSSHVLDGGSQPGSDGARRDAEGLGDLVPGHPPVEV